MSDTVSIRPTQPDIRALITRQVQELLAVIPDTELLGEVTIAGVTFRRHGVLTMVLGEMVQEELTLAVMLRWAELEGKR